MAVISTATWLEDERELIAAMRGGDSKVCASAQTLYVTAYTKRLFLILRRYSMCDANAEDLCQQTWEQALPRLRDGRYIAVPGRSSLSWLIAIALNLTKQSHRSWARDQTRSTSYGQQLELVPRWNPNPEEVLAVTELRARFRRALTLLPQAQRDAITKLYVSGIHDAAERRRLSSNACKGLQRLKSILEAEEQGHVAQSR